jgi:hypothetical protein
MDSSFACEPESLLADVSPADALDLQDLARDRLAALFAAQKLPVPAGIDAPAPGRASRRPSLSGSASERLFGVDLASLVARDAQQHPAAMAAHPDVPVFLAELLARLDSPGSPVEF